MSLNLLLLIFFNVAHGDRIFEQRELKHVAGRHLYRFLAYTMKINRIIICTTFVFHKNRNIY